MSQDSELVELIERARAAEAPGPLVREQVRRRLQRQLQSGASDPSFEQAVLPPAPRALPGVVRWGVPAAVALGTLALIAPRLAPHTADPLSQAPTPVLAPAPATPPSEPAPPAATAEAPATSSAPGETEATASHVTQPHSPAAARRAAPPRPLPPPDLLAESRALQRVQQALRDGQPQQALSLLGTQERQFARGALHEERAAARAIALCSAGQHAAGQRAAASFTRRYPHSVLSARVQSSCASPGPQ